MQDYIELAHKNGITLLDSGKCQFCNAETQRGIRECLEIFSLGFENIDFNDRENQMYRFLLTDAHVLQHPEIHGRWNNHIHLTRLRLIFHYQLKWYYSMTIQLSAVLKQYKTDHQDEFLIPPAIGNRGSITTIDIAKAYDEGLDVRELIRDWAFEVYKSWKNHHGTVDEIAKMFLEK